MILISQDMCAALAEGVAVLGSGGGGEPSLERLALSDLLYRGYQVRMITVEELPADAYVVPVACMGAPMVTFEKIPTISQCLALSRMIKDAAAGRPLVIMAAEIGGGNGILPLIMAALLEVPVLDADLMGRAFPEIPMVAPALFGAIPSPFYMVGTDGAATITADSSVRIEEIARGICVSLGSAALVATYCMDGATARSCIIPGTVSLAFHIGHALIAARINGKDPIAALLRVVKGREYARGTIVSIEHTLDNGFLRGRVLISGDADTVLIFKNEYLAINSAGKIVATTPDILLLLDEQTGAAIATEALTHGIRVVAVAIQAPAVWRTLQGLSLVGPRAFGIETPYQEIQI